MGTGALSWGLKWPGHGVDHPSPFSAAVKNEQSCTTVPTLCLHDMLQKNLHLYIYLYLVTKGDCHVKEQELLDNRVP
jgi:hypothetical protein